MSSIKVFGFPLYFQFGLPSLKDVLDADVYVEERNQDEVIVPSVSKPCGLSDMKKKEIEKSIAGSVYGDTIDDKSKISYVTSNGKIFGAQVV